MTMTRSSKELLTQTGNYEFDPKLAMQRGEKPVYAIGMMIVTSLLAQAAKWAFAKLLDKVRQLGAVEGPSALGADGR